MAAANGLTTATSDAFLTTARTTTPRQTNITSTWILTRNPPVFARFVVAEAETLSIEEVEAEADSLGTASEGVETEIETVRPSKVHATCAVCRAITPRIVISSSSFNKR